MNISVERAETITEEVSELFKVLGHPSRVEILLEIGEGEACVCHLEAILNQRQAYISQHLMVLREAGLLTSRQEGRYVFYQLRDQETLTLIRTAGKLLGVLTLLNGRSLLHSECPCPKCRS